MNPKDFDYTQFSPAERLLLAQNLWDSVLHDDAIPATMPEQRIEILRRIALSDADQMIGLTWPEAQAILRMQG